MYKGQRIKELLEARGLAQKDLLEHLGVRDNGTINRFTGTDIKASRLEQIAEFFGVSVDYFFESEGDVNFAPDGAAASKGGHAEYHAGGAKPSAKVRELNEKIKLLQSQLALKESSIKDKENLIREKDERIKLLERMINFYESK